MAIAALAASVVGVGVGHAETPSSTGLYAGLPAPHLVAAEPVLGRADNQTRWDTEPPVRVSCR